MGQQQLLLIVLGIIIVGLSVIVGINVFTANAVNAKRDNVTNDLLHQIMLRANSPTNL